MATILQPKPFAPPSPLSSSSSSSSSSSLSSSPSSTPAPRRKTMSITQTYYLAHKARAKLSNEASRSDHNLRLLVGHANLLDSLMIELADAEREQESWFNQSVRGAAEPHHQRQQQQQQQQQILHHSDSDDWAVEDDSESESDSDISDDISDDEDYEGEGEDEDEDEDIEMADVVSVRRIPQQHQLTRVPSRRRTPLPAMFDTIAEEEEEEEDEDCADLGLSKIPSYSTPPELDHDADTSEDEAMPPSPQQDALTFPATTKDADADVIVPDAHEERDLADGATPHEKPNALYAEGYIVPPENPSSLLPTFARVY